MFLRPQYRISTRIRPPGRARFDRTEFLGKNCDEFFSQLASLTVTTLPKSLTAVLHELKECLVEERDSDRTSPENIRNPLKRVGLSWKGSDSEKRFYRLINEDIIGGIMQSLFLILDAREKQASDFDLKIGDLTTPSEPFCVIPRRYAACMSAIDNYCIGHLLHVWQESGTIASSSFAVAIRRMRVWQESESDRALLKIHYRKSGGARLVTFNKSSASAFDPSELPVCAWQLAQFMETAETLRPDKATRPSGD